MPQEELIDQYVDRSSFRSDTEFVLANLKEVLEAYKQLSGTKVNLSGATTTSGVAGAAQKLNKETAEAIKLNERLSKTHLNNAKAAREQANAEKLQAQARKENATAAEKEAKATQTSAKSQKENQKLIDQVSNDYLQLSRAYNDAALKAKNYALTLGESHPITIEAVKDAKSMHDILLRVDQAVGQSQRNVGNYKSGFDGLGMSFAQVSRELPSLTISVQQFALAISNNLPMVADEIAKAKREISALRAEGQETPSLFKRIMGAMLGWQVLLSVGIALLTAYASKIVDWVGSLFSGAQALEKAAESQRQLNEATKKAIDLQEEYDRVTKRSFGTKNRELENLIEYSRAAGKSDLEILKLERQLLEQRQALASQRFFSTNGLKSLDELELKLSSAKSALLEFLQTPISASGESLEFGTEAFNKREAQLRAELEVTEKTYAKQKDIVEEFYNVNRDLQIKDAEIAKAKAEQRIKFFDEELKDLAALNKAISESEGFQGNTRVAARKKAFNLEKQILEGHRNEEILKAKGNANEIFEIQRAYAYRRRKLEEELQIDLLVIRADANKRQREMDAELNKMFHDDMKERTAREVAAVVERSEKTAAALAQQQATEVERLDEWYRKRLIATRGNQKAREKLDKEYAERRAQIEYIYARFILQNEIALAEQLITIRKAAGLSVTEEESKLASLRMKLSDIETKHVLDNEKHLSDKRVENLTKLEKAISKIKDVYNEVANFTTGLISAFTDRQKNAIQDQIDALDAQKQKEIEVVNQTITNEQEKAAAIAVINARAQSKKEQLELRQRQLDIQRARFEKAANIGRIVIETALAVVHQLATGDPFTAVGRAIAAGAIGAAQLAVAIAQPIPKFKHGREGGPATLGIVNDGGKQEVITSPDLSQAYLPKGKNTVTYLPENWRVFPDVDSFLDTANTMAASNMPRPVAVDSNGKLIWAMQREIRGLKAAMLGRSEHHTYFDNGDVRHAVKNGNTYWKYIQDNIR